MARFPRLKRKDSTPVRQVTGTSYAAKGAEVKAPTLKELGSATSNPLFDPVPAVGTETQATRTYLRMVRDDASVRMSLRAGKAPVLGAEWFIEPFSADFLDLDIAEFIEFNLFNGMTTPWIHILEQILQMYESGRTVFEPVWEPREWAPRKIRGGANRKQYTMLRKLAFRPPSTIQKINYDDNGGPVEIIHNATDKDGNVKEVPIPIEKAVVFVFDRQGGGLDGMPILRSAYKHWWYKNQLYNIDAIQKERHGIGVPDVEIQPGASQEDWALAHELGRNLRTNEYAYIVRPPTIKVGFAEIKTNLVDALESALHHDRMIQKNIMVEFLNVGDSGGRATAATSMDMFLKSMRHITQSICDCINMYLIPNLVAYNFPTDRFPQLSVRGVGEVKDMQMWGGAMRALAESGLITIDEPTEQWIRANADMPKLTTPWQPITERPDRVQALLQGTLNQEGSNGNGNGNVAAKPAGNKSTSKNGGGGNIGKSPSSGAV